MHFGAIGAELAFVSLPGFALWWLCRRLARHPDDPLLAERLLAVRRTGRIVAGVTVGLLIILWPDHLVWSVPALIVGRAVGAYPSRRSIHAETWSLFAYLWFFTRLVVAVFGFWLLLLCTPALVGAARPHEWAAAACLLLVLLLWNRYYASAFCGVLGATVLPYSAFASELDDLAARAGIAVPRVYIAHVAGGCVANAIALPSLTGSRVVFSSTLLERFDRDEILAVHAHELAHIEHFDRRRLNKRLWATFAVCAMGALAMPLAETASSIAGSWIEIVWIVAILMFYGYVARARQAGETASDLRAIELTGNPDALIRALVKLHAAARLPRRWDGETERHASHPSLARRIQAIRSAADDAPAGLADLAIFASGTASMAFFDDHVVWTSDQRRPVELRYDELRELRLDARRARRPKIVAVDTAGRRWELPVASADLARAQAVLDAVDGRLASAARPPGFPSSVVRVVALLTMATAVTAEQFAVLLPALLTVVTPSTPLVAAAGVAALASTLLASMPPAIGAETIWPAAALGACAAALLGATWHGRRDAARSRKSIVILAAGAALTWLLLALAGLDAVHLNQLVREWPSIAVLPMALAAALAFGDTRARRVAAAAVATAGVVASVVGSSLWLRVAARDPFAAFAPPALSAKPIAGRPLAYAMLPFQAFDIRVSPNGRLVVLRGWTPSSHTFYRAGPPSGPFVALPVASPADVAFVDDARLLVASADRDGIAIEQLRLDGASAVEWVRLVPAMTMARLAVAPDGRWRALGRDDRNVVLATGTSRDDAFEIRRWPAVGSPDADDDDDEPDEAIDAASSGALVQRRRAVDALRPRRGLAILAPFAPRWTETELRVAGAAGEHSVLRTQMDVECLGAFPDGRPLCTMVDGRTTTLFRLDLATRRAAPVAMLRGWARRARASGNGWMSGVWNRGAFALRLNTGEAWQVGSPDQWAVVSAAAGETVVAVMTSGERRSAVAVFERR